MLPLTVQTAGVALANETVRPELAVAETRNGALPSARSGIGGNVIACGSAVVVWLTGAADCGAKFASPPYCAAMAAVPATLGENEHDVAGSVIVQPSTPRETATVPVGVPVPGATTSATLTMTGERTADGSGVCAVIVNVTVALVTSYDSVPLLAAFPVSPP